MKLTPELIVFIFGLLLFALGLALVYLPAGLIGPGVVLMAIIYFGDRSNKS